MLRTLEEAQSDLSPLLNRMRSCIQKALQEFVDDFKTTRARLSNRSIANVIHDLMRGQVEKEFPKGNQDGVRAILTRGNLFVLMIGDKYRIKLKKMREALRTSNFPTQSALRFLDQGGQLELVPSPTNLFLGYRQKSPAELLTSEIWVTCPNGDRHPHWKMEVLPEKGADIAPISEKSTRKSRVIPRKDVAKNAEAPDEDKAADGNNEGK